MSGDQQADLFAGPEKLARVLKYHIMADNGILHVVDKVLVPPFTML